jgi:arylsulfatase A-like enzyme
LLPKEAANNQMGGYAMLPNIIIITTDQQRTDTLGCYGSTFVDTPHLDQMANDGVRFTRAYCTNPVCTPSRASIFSGKYISRHGAYNVGVPVPDDEVFLSHRLKKQGYQTHLIGKAHFQPYRVPESVEGIPNWEDRYPEFGGPYYGFDTVELTMAHTTGGLTGHYGCWVKEKAAEHGMTNYKKVVRRSERRFGGEALDWDLPLEWNNSFWTAERTVAYLKRAANSNEPFFLSVNFQDPHPPLALNKEAAEQLDLSKIPLPDFTEGELDDKPPHFKHIHEGTLKGSRFLSDFLMAGQATNYDYRGISDEDARRGRAYYYALVHWIDHAIGSIMETLDECGLAENTLVIFTSDHGELLGDHGFWLKGPLHYEQIINVPLLVKWKGHINPGQVVDQVTSLADIVPTVLACCDMEAAEEVDGVNLMPVLQDQTAKVRDHVLVECTDDPTTLRLKTIVTERYKLTFYFGETFGELYDLQTDRAEKGNLWEEDSMKQIKIELLMKLLNETEKLEKRELRLAHV